MILRLRGSARNPKSCFYPSLYRRSRRYKVIVEVLTKSRLLINRAIRPIIYMSIGLDMHEVISSTLIVSTKRKPRKSLFGKEIRGFSYFRRKKKTASFVCENLWLAVIVHQYVHHLNKVIFCNLGYFFR